LLADSLLEKDVTRHERSRLRRCGRQRQSESARAYARPEVAAAHDDRRWPTRLKGYDVALATQAARLLSRPGSGRLRREGPHPDPPSPVACRERVAGVPKRVEGQPSRAL